MASYFDEHNCEPLGENQQPNFYLHLARLLVDTGVAAEFEPEFSRLFEQKVPPASKTVIENLPSQFLNKSHPLNGKKCPICLAMYKDGEELKELPCEHCFHKKCIIPWLERVNTCPLCRREMETDDPDYEAIRKHRAREKERQQELDALHNSMFG